MRNLEISIHPDNAWKKFLERRSGTKTSSMILWHREGVCGTYIRGIHHDTQKNDPIH